MTETIAESLRERYANIAKTVQAGSGCCDSDCCSSLEDDDVTRDLYTPSETELLPEEAVLASLGGGNPTALIDLKAGEHTSAGVSPVEAALPVGTRDCGSSPSCCR